jgi:hypothetical protein
MGKCFSSQGEITVTTLKACELPNFTVEKIRVSEELESIEETSEEFSYSFEKVFSDLELEYAIICSELSSSPSYIHTSS